MALYDLDDPGPLRSPALLVALVATVMSPLVIRPVAFLTESRSSASAAGSVFSQP